MIKRIYKQGNSNKKLLWQFLLGSLICWIPSLTTAEKYQLIEPEDETPKICVEFLDNLKVLDQAPMVCNRNFHAEYKQFTWPKWEKLDPWENRDYIFQIWDKRYNDYPDKKRKLELIEGLKGHIKEAIARGDLTMSLVQITLENKINYILRVVENAVSDSCSPQKNWIKPLGREHYIINLENRRVEFKRTEFSILAGINGDANDNNADLFFYNEIPYVAYWVGDYPGESGMLYLLGDDKNYCVYKFTNKWRGKK